MSQALYTIGHSTHSLAQFLDLLAKHGISAIGDVRSTPYSRLHPQFNRESLQKEMVRHHIAYVFLGGDLGAGFPVPSCFGGARSNITGSQPQTHFVKGLPV
jgi:uncharacterized protein (DUF488 family)